MDLGIFTDSAPDNNGFKFAFVAIDIFIKICHAVPIKDKKPNECLRAMKEILDVIGIPKVLCHDNESHKIKQIITSSPRPFAKRMVQTLKNMIHTRLDGLDLDKVKWLNYYHLL